MFQLIPKPYTTDIRGGARANLRYLRGHLGLRQYAAVVRSRRCNDVNAKERTIRSAKQLLLPWPTFISQHFFPAESGIVYIRSFSFNIRSCHVLAAYIITAASANISLLSFPFLLNPRYRFPLESNNLRGNVYDAFFIAG